MASKNFKINFFYSITKQAKNRKLIKKLVSHKQCYVLISNLCHLQNKSAKIQECALLEISNSIFFALFVMTMTENVFEVPNSPLDMAKKKQKTVASSPLYPLVACV